MAAVGALTEILRKEGLTRTDLYCHSCEEKKLPYNFIATIDFSLNGNHEIECPRCGHIHYRLIKDGVVTDIRYSSGYPTHKVERREVWKSQTTPNVTTSVASSFIRDLWLRR